MFHKLREIGALGAVFLLICTVAVKTSAQTAPGASSIPYQIIPAWGDLPGERTWGSSSGLSTDSKGHIWLIERCGGNSCFDRTEAPVLEFDPSGRLLKSFGAEMFVFPHGLFVDKDDNVWIADADGKDGKGHQVVKFSPEGKVLMTLGKPGIAGDGPDTFNCPSGVAVAANGDIFVSDGHGQKGNDRIVKFSPNGKFLTAWGKKGTGPGEFGEPHAVVIDSTGRVFVADRANNRIQIFDQNGKFLEQWTQFGRPSNIFFDNKGMIYVTDNTDPRTSEWPKGIRIGSVKDGVVTAFIPDPDTEFITVDASDNIYAVAAMAVPNKRIKKYIKQ